VGCCRLATLRCQCCSRHGPTSAPEADACGPRRQRTGRPTRCCRSHDVRIGEAGASALPRPRRSWAELPNFVGGAGRFAGTECSAPACRSWREPAVAQAPESVCAQPRKSLGLRASMARPERLPGRGSPWGRFVSGAKAATSAWLARGSARLGTARLGSAAWWAGDWRPAGFLGAYAAPAAWAAWASSVSWGALRFGPLFLGGGRLGVSLLSFAWRCVIPSAQHRMHLLGAGCLASLAFPWPLAPAPGFQRRLLAALGRAWQ
jgi:hypothetical protein